MFNDPPVRVVAAGVALSAEGEGALRPASHTATCGSPKRLSTTKWGPWGGTVAHRRVVRRFLASEARAAARGVLRGHVPRRTPTGRSRGPTRE